MVKPISNIDKYLKLEDIIKENLEVSSIIGDNTIWMNGKFGFTISYRKNSVTDKFETVLEYRTSAIPSEETLLFPLTIVEALYLKARHFLLCRIVSKYQQADIREKQLMKRQSEYDTYVKKSEEKFTKYFTNIR
jgi:hypothetical protein